MMCPSSAAILTWRSGDRRQRRTAAVRRAGRVVRQCAQRRPQGLSAARWGVTRPRAAVTAGRRWSPPSATAGAWAAAAPSTPAFWCPPVPRTGRRGFSQPQRCAQRFDRRARVQRQLRGRSSRASRSRRTCRPRRSSACPRACRPPCRRKAIATWRRWCRRRAQDLAQREPDLHRRRVLVLPTLGAFSAAYTTSRLSRQEGKRNRATLSWNRSFARTSVSLSMAKDLSTGTRARSENQYFLTLSFPGQRQRQHLCQQVRQ